MTGTRLEIEEGTRYLNLLPNTILKTCAQKNLERLGLPKIDARERAFATEIRAALSEEEKSQFEIPETQGLDLAEKLPPYRPHGSLWFASTDVGDVSWVTPTLQYWSAVWAIGTQLHTWQIVAQGRSSLPTREPCMREKC